VRPAQWGPALALGPGRGRRAGGGRTRLAASGPAAPAVTALLAPGQSSPLVGITGRHAVPEAFLPGVRTWRTGSVIQFPALASSPTRAGGLAQPRRWSSTGTPALRVRARAGLVLVLSVRCGEPAQRPESAAAGARQRGQPVLPDAAHHRADRVGDGFGETLTGLPRWWGNGLGGARGVWLGAQVSGLPGAARAGATRSWMKRPCAERPREECPCRDVDGRRWATRDREIHGARQLATRPANSRSFSPKDAPAAGAVARSRTTQPRLGRRLVGAAQGLPPCGREHGPGGRASMSACRGLATNRMPSPSMFVVRVVSRALISSSQPLHEPGVDLADGQGAGRARPGCRAGCGSQAGTPAGPVHLGRRLGHDARAARSCLRMFPHQRSCPE